MPNYPLRSSPPWHFRFAKWLIRNRLRGGYQLIELAERRGWLNYLVEYDLHNQVKLAVPLWRRVNQWALPDLLAYEQKLVTQLALFSNLSRSKGGISVPVYWIDVGADIGALTALVAAQSKPFAEAILLEPNPVAFEFLERNAAKFPFPARAVQAAVSNFAGRGKLANSPTDPSDHSRFLAPAGDGDIEVVRIDDLGIPPGGSVLIKVDVEGGELAVLQGAEQTLRAAKSWCVAFEAHRDVCRRTGIDPCEGVRFLATLGKVDSHVAECREIKLDLTRPYFEQVSEKITNVICMHSAN